MTMKILAAAAVFAGMLGAAPAQRFDNVVRNGFFAGFRGDREALDQSMKICEQILANEPKHAEALVWHGGGLVFLSGQAFRAGDREKGIELWVRGNKELDDAVALSPKSIGVLIPRGAVLLAATKAMPPERARPSIEKGVSDYETAYALQKDALETMGVHPKGELLFGIAEANARLGNLEKAGSFFELITNSLPGTEYARRAKIWLDTRSLTVEQTQCIGCHVP
jgi:hypothetical protein